MKKHLIPIIFLLTLTGCLQSMPSLESFIAPSHSPAEMQAIKSIEFVTVNTLPADKHIKVIGKATGNYNTEYGSQKDMRWEMQIAAYELKGNAILPYSTRQDYISITSTTVITGTGQVVSYIPPEKPRILADFALAERGGMVTLSAARFAGKYLEAEPIARNIIERSKEGLVKGAYTVSALNVLAEVKGRDAIDYFFDYIANADAANSLHAFTAIAPYINKQDQEKLVRFMKFHESEHVKIEAAKLLIKFGERKAVESYAERTSNQQLFKLLM